MAKLSTLLQGKHMVVTKYHLGKLVPQELLSQQIFDEGVRFVKRRKSLKRRNNE